MCRTKVLTLISSVLLAASSCAAAAAESNLAGTIRSLIGVIDRSSIIPAPIGETGCINQGGGLLYVSGRELDDWSIGQATCNGRTVLLLKRVVSGIEGQKGWQIVDARLLPVLRNGDELFQQGDCELEGKADTSLIAVVHLGRRNRVDHRAGVLAAWSADVPAARIVPIDTKRVVCYRPTPP